MRLLSRNRLPQNYPPISEAIANLPVRDVILDGEVTWSKTGPVYHVFDVLWLDGRDVMSLPLDERRAVLDTLPLRSLLQRVALLTDLKPWERACSEGWEGVIAKRRDSPYERRRSPHWLKMRCEASQELLVGYFENEDFVFAGKVGTGFDTMPSAEAFASPIPAPNTFWRNLNLMEPQMTQ